MKIRHISVERIRIPLKVRFSQANNSTQQSDSVILRLETQKETIGYGESCPRPYVTGEDAQTVIRAYKHHHQKPENPSILLSP